MQQRRRPPWLAMACGLGVVAGALAGCTTSASIDFSTVKPPIQSKATIAATPSSPHKARPGQRIVVTASDGRLAHVSVTGPSGPVGGSLSPDGTVWTAGDQRLAFGSTYTVSATAVDSRGLTATSTDEIQTVAPKDFVSASVDPGEGETVGVGTPISVVFDADVRDKEQALAAISIHTPTALEGAWSWKDDHTAIFRPRHYWPGNIDVTVAVRLDGVRVDKGTFGRADTITSFHIGPSMVTKVNAVTDEAKVFRDGQKIRTIPITTGKPGFETRSGTLIILTKETTRIMDAATGGTDTTDPEYYRLEVHNAMRITYSGEFLHAAPWSVGSQGSANVSHGCVGMSLENAQWLFDHSDLGDVVEITGTSVPQNLGNGVTIWTETWDEWLGHSSGGALWTVAPGAAPA